jgi:hypothetical protein
MSSFTPAPGGFDELGKSLAFSTEVPLGGSEEDAVEALTKQLTDRGITPRHSEILAKVREARKNG